MIEQAKLNVGEGEVGPGDNAPLEHDPRPKRHKARTPFVIFMSENKDKYSGLGRNFLKEIGRIWTELDEDVRKVYTEKARAERDAAVADISDAHASAVFAPRSKFPLRRLKEILKEDAQVYKKLRPETCEYVAEIVDVFASELLHDALSVCKRGGKRKLVEAVFEDVRKKNYKYRFLSDVKLSAPLNRKSDVNGDKANVIEEEEEVDELLNDKEGDQVREEQVKAEPARGSIASFFKK